MNDYELDLLIDQDALDQELRKQPRIYQKYAEALASANALVVELKEKLELVKAKTDTFVRRAFDAEGKKSTEALVAAEVCKDDEVQTLQGEVRDAAYRAEVLKGVVIALDHKKKSLEGLVTLYVGQYFSAPRASAQQEAASQAQRAGLKSRSKE